MLAKSIPTDIGSRFSYNPDTGILYNRYGRPVGSRGSSGYAILQLSGGAYPVHRVAHYLMTGCQLAPHECVDHINRDRMDNRWCNLRVATDAQNKAYALCPSRELPLGVSKCGSRYKATVGHTYLGLFRTPEEAAEAYQQAFNLRYGSEWNITSLAA